MKNSLVVGYLESWSPNKITFTQATEKGYNTIVMAFGEIKETEVGVANGVFNPSPTNNELKKDIQNAKKRGAKHILFSVGGEKNTYFPGDASAESIAKAVVRYLKEYGFTGIDFDLEIDTNEKHLDSLCAEIRKLDSSLLITAAPQLNQNEHESDLFLVSTGNFQPYNLAVKNNRFDYLFIQAYNNQWPQVNRCSEMDVCFISNAFKNLKKNIPPKTMITIGEPASIDAAGANSIFHGPDSGKHIYKLIAKQYESISNDPQFGGAMTWSINKDANNNWQFIKAIKTVITKANPVKSL